MLTWELLGAAVGAGLASGREVASFFGRNGAWGYTGILLAVGTIALLASATLPPRWRGRWPERLWEVVQGMLLTVTGGTMLSGAGEAAAMALPGRWTHLGAMALTLMLAWSMSGRTNAGLGRVSRLLLLAMALLLLPALGRPSAGKAPPAEAGVLPGLIRGAFYGGFNAALMHPLLQGRGGEQHRSLVRACVLLALLLGAGLYVLLRHGAAMEEEMPFVLIASEAGRGALLLAAACLYLATLSTLTACLRGLGRGLWPLLGTVLAATLGFSGAVEAAYPMLGALCMAMLLAMRGANFRNSRRRAFHSASGVL